MIRVDLFIQVVRTLKVQVFWLIKQTLGGVHYVTWLNTILGDILSTLDSGTIKVCKNNKTELGILSHRIYENSTFFTHGAVSSHGNKHSTSVPWIIDKCHSFRHDLPREKCHTMKPQPKTSCL